MARGGIAEVPLSMQSHPDRLLPNRPLALWPYTDPGDRRLQWKRNEIRIRQGAGKPLKIGLYHPGAWMSYARSGLIFRKRALQPVGAIYPDFNSTHEIYTNAKMLELETLGPLVRLRPGGKLVHVEEWELH
jgi:hypothetical protein